MSSGHTLASEHMQVRYKNWGHKNELSMVYNEWIKVLY